MLRTRREDAVIEALLSHEEVEDCEYADLSKALAVISQEGRATGDDDKAAEVAVMAARIARSGEGGTTRRIRASHRPLIPRLATAALAALLVTGFTGVAVASDAAGPGSALYGLDRALERIGVNDGGLEERIAEANALVAKGSLPEALDHLADSLRSTPAGAAAALHAAADKVRGSGSIPESSQMVRADVAGMLEWMAQLDVRGPDFGQSIAERARAIGESATSTGTGQAGKGAKDGRGNGEGRGNGNGPPGGTPPGLERP